MKKKNKIKKQVIYAENIMKTSKKKNEKLPEKLLL